jgi:hypothetical protein
MLASDDSIDDDVDDLAPREIGAHHAHDESPGPCPKCVNVERCRCGEACKAFAMFVRFGGEVRWLSAPRQPSSDVFDAIYNAKQMVGAKRGRGRRVRNESAGAAR